MKPEQPKQQPTPQPVAYDTNGRPLYAHPPAGQPATPQVVYMSRPLEPHQPTISPEVQKRCEESRKKFPHLNLSDGEFVISNIHRHPIGLLSIWAVVAVVVALMFIFIPLLLSDPAALSSLGIDNVQAAAGSIVLILLLLAACFVGGGALATYVYQANQFYLTNESVIQHIQHSVFSHKMQTISLANIEDASYKRSGILQSILNYGSLRLSTEGDETTYRFNYVSNPHKQVDLLNDAVESFKNGRPFANIGDD